jgi:RNase adapter protein RapZ
MNQRVELLVLSGMSGAGRSTAARALEDLGWFVIDNLPPGLLNEALAAIADRSDVDRVAVVVDVRGGALFADLQEELTVLHQSGTTVRTLYLEAADTVLVRRFESSRRPHPLQGSDRIVDGLARERVLLADLRGEADLVIDTSELTVHDLRRAIDAAFRDDEETIRLRATVLSFGFKHGIPVDADYVLDVRFLPNPHWVPELRPLTGLDRSVNDYVLANAEAKLFLERAADLLDVVADGFLNEGKAYVTVAIGCTGGHHRSVAMAENLAARLVKAGVETRVVHRDIERD